MTDDAATERDAKDARPESGAPGPRARKYGRSLCRFFVAAALTSLCFWVYLRAGAGAAGLLGYVLLLAPAALLVSALLLPRLTNRARTGWVSLLMGLLLPFALVSCELPEWVSRKSFDSVAWKASGGGRSQERLRQVDALLASGTLDRRSRSSVLDLLGPDDSAEGTGWGKGYFVDWALVYWLGRERGFISIDSEWLVFRFDGAGVVQEYRIVRD